MFATYLFREISNRRKQTAIIAIGLALAIALVIIVNGVAAGVQNAQSTILSSIYGVGTDVTVSQEPAAPAAGTAPTRPKFDFGAGAGATSDGTTAISQTRLSAGFGTTTFDATALDSVTAVSHVSAATATLALTNSSFSGQLPDFAAGGGRGKAGTPPTDGGADGAGGSSFSVDSFTVTGIDVAGDAVGPLTSTTLIDGRGFTAADVGTDVAVLDKTYATSAALAVGGTIAIGGTDFQIIGIVGSTSSDATTAANSYIPLDVAQTLSGLTGQVSTIYVKAASSSNISQIQTDIAKALPNAKVSSQADLASSVSGSLTTASDLVSNLGTWLSAIVLAAAFLIAILFTISGVTRRTREFGTLKAIGWSNSRIVRQVAGESFVQGLLGGVFGIVIGLGGLFAVNAVAPTLSASASVATSAQGVFGGGGGGGRVAAAAPATTEIALQAPFTLSIILIAVGLAVLGGLLAGAIGGWRAARLRPAEALRSVA
jgi:ABC-type antimicrobial peptide transport system permease subunit